MPRGSTYSRGTFGAGFGRAPGRVRTGSTAFHAKNSMASAKGDMAAIIRRYADLIRRLESATPTIIRDALMPAFNRSQVYVPKKTGALMASGQLNVVPGPNGRPQAEIIYGGASAPYAAIVHEATWLAHRSPTRSKFLQAALEEEMDSFLSSVAVDYAMLLGR